MVPAARPRGIDFKAGKIFWSNGIHLNGMEWAVDLAGEPWRESNAIDDVMLEILTTLSTLPAREGIPEAEMISANDFLRSEHHVFLDV